VPGMTRAEMSGVTLLNPAVATSSAVRAMLQEAVVPAEKLLIDFAPVGLSAGRIVGLLSFLAVLGIAGSSLWNYLQLQQKVESLKASQQRIHNNEVKSHVLATPEERERINSELRFANRVIEKLDTPWDSMFGAVEGAFNEQVTLLSIEPDTERQEVRLLAEARDMMSMLDYVQQIRQSPVLKNGYLVDHQIDLQDPQRPVRFTVIAGWVIPRLQVISRDALTASPSVEGGKP
jgi:hypothetical protein